jgi:hypothetical protein
MSPLTKGTLVRQVVPIISGTVERIVFDEEAHQLSYLVAYADADGHAAERWFAQDQIEAMPAADLPAAPTAFSSPAEQVTA